MTPNDLIAAPPRWLDFRNDSGEEIPAFGIIRLTGVALPETGELVYTAAKPNTYGSQYSHAINSEAPVPDNGYGKCTLTFPAVAVYDDADGTPAFGEMWGPRNATWKLKKNTGGFRIVGISNSDLKLVLVTQDPFLRFRGTTTGAIAADAQGTCNIFYRSSVSAYTDTTVDTPTGSVTNDLDDTVSSGAVVECVYDPYTTGTEGWRIVQADCP